MAVYPVLKEDIFYAKIQTPEGTRVSLRNTTTGKEFKVNDSMIALLDLCTGNTAAEIADILSEESGEPVGELAQKVNAALTILQKKGIIMDIHLPEKGITKRKATIKLRYPLETAQIEITNKCNLSCVHCFNDSGNAHPDELTTKEIQSLIDTLSSMGVYKVTFSGGEPLLHPDLLSLVEYARKAPMAVDIFTNGTLITKELITAFTALGVNRFNISIDSVDEHIHDTFRGKRGALKRTLHAITLLKEAGFSVKPVISLSQYNKDVIIDILQYLKGMHVDSFDIIPVRYSGRGMLKGVVSANTYYQVLVDVFTYIKREAPEFMFTIHETTGKGCSIARSSIGVKSDGTIIPCPGCDRTMGIGNYKDVHLESLWETHDQLTRIRKTTVKTDNTCSLCVYVNVCEGCIAGAFSTGKIQCYYPFLCALNRAYDDVFEGFKTR